MIKHTYNSFKPISNKIIIIFLTQFLFFAYEKKPVFSYLIPLSTSRYSAHFSLNQKIPIVQEPTSKFYNNHNFQSKHRRNPRSLSSIVCLQYVKYDHLLLDDDDDNTYDHYASMMIHHNELQNCGNNIHITRKDAIQKSVTFMSSLWITLSQISSPASAGPTLDVNNAIAREYTAFPGLYPTIATKLVNAAKEKPFKSKAEVYAALDSDAQVERLKQYDAAIVISKPDSSVRQFKESQICKYECKGRVSARQ